jgi:hypothetical protein
VAQELKVPCWRMGEWLIAGFRDNA